MYYSNILDYLSLIPLTIIGLICFYTDVKYGKIFNKWIGLSLLCILFIYIFLFFDIIFLNEQANEKGINYILASLINGFIAFFGGYLLWYFKFWAAADAKLFAVYAFLIPLHFYSKSYLPIFPSFNLLINLFIPLFLILTAKALFTVLEESHNLIDKMKNIVLSDRKKGVSVLLSLLRMFLNFLFALLLLQLLASLTGHELLGKISFNPIFNFALLFLIRSRLNKLTKKRKWLNFIIYGIVLGYSGFLIISGQAQLLINILKSVLIFMILISSMRQLFNFYIQEKEIKKIEIENLQRGMIPVKNAMPIILTGLKKLGKEEGFERVDASGFNKKQVELIKNAFHDNQKSKISIHKTFPFAPFLFLSAIISISTKSSFFPYIAKSLSWLQNLL